MEVSRVTGERGPDEMRPVAGERGVWCLQRPVFVWEVMANDVFILLAVELHANSTCTLLNYVKRES